MNKSDPRLVSSHLTTGNSATHISIIDLNTLNITEKMPKAPMHDFLGRGSNGLKPPILSDFSGDHLVGLLSIYS